MCCATARTDKCADEPEVRRPDSLGSVVDGEGVGGAPLIILRHFRHCKEKGTGVERVWIFVEEFYGLVEFVFTAEHFDAVPTIIMLFCGLVPEVGCGHVFLTF